MENNVSETPASAASPPTTPNNDKDMERLNEATSGRCREDEPNDDGPNKRAKTSPINEEEAPSHIHDATNTITPDTNTFVDIPSSLNLTPGTRIQVLWDVFESENDDIPTEHWWGATLLPYDDGRTFMLADEDENFEEDEGDNDGGPNDNDKPVEKTKDYCVLPLRRLDYDAYPEGGFPERSMEDVCFMTDQALFLISTNDTTLWRLEGQGADTTETTNHLVSMVDMSPHNLPVGECEDETPEDEISVSSSSPQEALRSMINTILQSAMVKSGVMEKMAKLPASQQLVMAERIAASKEKLIAKMEHMVQADPSTHVADGDCNTNRGGIVVTAEHVRKCMEELKQELNM